MGSCLEALLFAFSRHYPVFFTNPQRPFRFDYLEPAVDLSCVKIFGDTKNLMTIGGEKSVGHAKELLWERLLFLLSLDGLAPLSSLCHNIRYGGDTVVCSNEYSKIMEFKFDTCHYFNDEATSGFASQNILDEDSYICYDYIAFNKGGKHEVDFIHTGDDFVSEIWFYGSDRIDGNTPVRDACTVSSLTREQLLDFEYSETMARFKAVHEMESRGMKGKFAHGYTTAGNPKHYNFRTTSIRRQTHKQRYEREPESPNVEIAEYDTQSLLEDLPQASLGYDRLLRNL